MIYLCFVTLMLYPVLLVAWVVTDATKTKRKQLLGAAAILAAGPFFIWLGLFFSMFGDNMCYSQTVSELVELPALYAQSNKDDAIQRFTSDAKKLPLEGYETNCQTLASAVQSMKRNVYVDAFK